MLTFVTICVGGLFSAFVFLDVLSVFPRVAGGITGRNGIGYSFQVLVNTVKRVFIVSYPPFLGVLAIQGTLQDLFFVIGCSYGIAGLWCLAAALLQRRFIAYFCSVIDSYGNEASLARSFLRGLTQWRDWQDAVSAELKAVNTTRLPSIDWQIFSLALWIFFFYGASIFMINILNFLIPQYSSVILQLTGLINALGSIALAFFLDPRLSRLYEKRNNILTALNGLIGAHLCNLFILSPLVFLALWLGI
ncbi:MAG: lipid II flippase family protein [Planktomarina sp.]